MKIIVLIIAAGLLWTCGKKKEDSFYFKQNSDFKKSITRGEIVYNELCTTCHLPNGEGVPKVFPPLANSDYLKNNPELSIKSVKYGLSGKIVVNGVTYNNVMASMGLTDQEVADVLNFINNSWGNKYGQEITVEKVTKISL